MLCVNKYTRKYIDGCRARVSAQLSSYRRLVTGAKKQNGAGNAALDSALESFEGDFFNHMVLALDNYFLPPKPNLRVEGSEPAQ
jgi:hypothetical protein